MPTSRPPRGMTLIELMIVLAISAVLLSIAIPSYKGYQMRAHRSNAKAALMRVAQFMERAATANGMYPATVPDSVRTVEGGRYTVSVVSSDGATFLATATRNAGTPQGPDQCGDFRIDHAGNRTIINNSGIGAADCWNR